MGQSVKIIIAMMVSVCSLALIACHKKAESPTEAPRRVMKAAIDALQSKDIGLYMTYVDCGEEVDSGREAAFRDVLRLYVEKESREHSSVTGVDIVDAVLESDTVCTVFCQYSFSDGTTEITSQKMIKRGEDWKVRLRN